MGSLLHCLKQHCCTDDDDEQPAVPPSYDPPRAAIIPRVQQQPHASVASLAHLDGNSSGTTGDCCANSSGLYQFWQKLTRQAAYEELATTETSNNPNVSIRTMENNIRQALPHSTPRPVPPSPLRTASSFDSSRAGVPTIPADEIVLPGSLLQKQMALEARRSLEDQGDECVVCLEGFDETNPRMPTHCGCGDNKTYFHLPCLFQWVDQSNQNCPSCRQQLVWEEF